MVLASEQIANVKNAYKEIYLRDLPLDEAKAHIAQAAKTQSELVILSEFLESSSRGIMR